jgi:tRNA nucleotidyltransferase/poly(A) polymerase
LHLQWVTATEIEKYVNGKKKLKKFLDDGAPQMEFIDESIHFNPDYIEVDRILDESGRDKATREYLVKWKSLGYDACTWETRQDLETKAKSFKEKLKFYKKINSLIAQSKAKKKVNKPKEPTGDITKLALTDFKDGRELKDYQQEGVRFVFSFLFFFFFGFNSLQNRRKNLPLFFSIFNKGGC